jgi:hypothetical protein
MYSCLCCVLCEISGNVLTKHLVVHRSPHLTKQRVSAESKRSGDYGIEDRGEGKERKSSILLKAHLNILALNISPAPPASPAILHCTALHCMLHAKHFYRSILASHNITQCHNMSCHIVSCHTMSFTYVAFPELPYRPHHSYCFRYLPLDCYMLPPTTATDI